MKLIEERRLGLPVADGCKDAVRRAKAGETVYFDGYIYYPAPRLAWGYDVNRAEQFIDIQAAARAVPEDA